MNGKLNLGVLEEELYENLMKARDKLKSHHGKGNKRRNFNQNKRQVLIFGPITLLNPKIGHKFKVKDLASSPLKSKCGHRRKLSILLMERFQMDDAFSFIQ